MADGNGAVAVNGICVGGCGEVGNVSGGSMDGGIAVVDKSEAATGVGKRDD